MRSVYLDQIVFGHMQVRRLKAAQAPDLQTRQSQTARLEDGSGEQLLGYLRIVGALKHLGFKVARSTIARWLAEADIVPAPTRSKRTSWSDFLRAHWGAIVATDFFTVEVLTWQGIVRYHVMFVMDLKSRLVTIAGVARDPDERWTMQVARNLLDACDGFLLRKTHIILDRDPVFSERFRGFLADAGVKPVRLPPFSPNLNSYAERFCRASFPQLAESASIASSPSASGTFATNFESTSSITTAVSGHTRVWTTSASKRPPARQTTMPPLFAAQGSVECFHAIIEEPRSTAADQWDSTGGNRGRVGEVPPPSRRDCHPL